ncbi:MAG: hypothetical protein HY326_05365 [Chloroflexi bacterium]|nr:hypothetical protein [Chloroflexota bacterium]
MDHYQLHDIQPDNRDLLHALIGDGRPLLMFTGLSLVLSGGFALFLAASGHFLPQDAQFLGMTADQLCGIDNCRVLAFMIHDRVAFGGALIGIGLLYMWLAEFPLRQGEAWAWWLFAVSGTLGFGSFLAYLGYGYLDTWHGIATLLLLPCYILGLIQSTALLPKPIHIRVLLKPSIIVSWHTSFGAGRLFLLMTGVGLFASGLTILIVGITQVFVPQDLVFMGLQPADLHSINPHLIPLIAHDRAGFGGALLTTGVTMFLAVWCGTPSRNLWQVLFLAGTAGFGAAIGIHPLIGYADLFHLAPALAGAIFFYAGLALCYRPMHSQSYTSSH